MFNELASSIRTSAGVKLAQFWIRKKRALRVLAHVDGMVPGGRGKVLADVSGDVAGSNANINGWFRPDGWPQDGTRYLVRPGRPWVPCCGGKKFRECCRQGLCHTRQGRRCGSGRADETCSAWQGRVAKRNERTTSHEAAARPQGSTLQHLPRMFRLHVRWDGCVAVKS